LTRRVGQAAILLLLYAMTYCGLRASRCLVHRNYLYWDERAPGYPAGGGYVDVHDVGHGSFFDEHGRPRNAASDQVVRAIFPPFVQAEAWFWQWREA
jgi:hypothetical protein